MKPLIKWPGGKSNEISKIEHLIPTYNRYVEPFFGGGALFFHLCPKKAIINDNSNSLMEYYSLIKAQDAKFHSLLLCYSNSFNNMLKVCNAAYDDILSIYNNFQNELISSQQIVTQNLSLLNGISDKLCYGFSEKLLLNENEFISHLVKMLTDKMLRTVINSAKKPFSPKDLKDNLITGFTSGYYMYFRKVYNDLNLGRINSPSAQYKAALFYFIREYCYGSMFRYNAKGEFNIPYGGISYNNKNFKNKLDNMFNSEIGAIFKNTDINCDDFEEFFKKSKLSSNDFIFLDPPYDTSFSNYSGMDFTRFDQERLAYLLQKTPAQFILIIKKTDFISDLYENKFNILSFDNRYTYNIRSRNGRDSQHLIITNLPV